MAEKPPRFEVLGLRLPEVKPGDDIARLIVDAASVWGGLMDGDIIVVTSKLVMKARGYMFKLASVKPSLTARLIARVTGKDPVEVELALRASKKIIGYVPVKRLASLFEKVSSNPLEARKLVEKIPALLFVVTRQGLIAMDGGVDYSNLPEGYAIANTVDFDEEARRLKREIETLSGKKVAVVITDTETNTSGKIGTVDVAVGSAGIQPVSKGFASKDMYGRPKFGGVDIIVDEIAAAAALLMGQTSEGIPAVIVRGLKYEESCEGVSDYTIGFAGLGFKDLAKNLLIRLIYNLFWRSNNR